MNQQRFRDRIKDFRRVKASDLHSNPRNWRTHPSNQQGAVTAMLEKIGFVGALVARETEQGLELIDGHLRADIAADEKVPVVIVDLDDKEAQQVLVTLDPLGDLAGTDHDILADLLGDIGSDLDAAADLRQLIADMSGELEKEEREKPERGKEVPGMALSPHEHYDYIVILATNTHDWNTLCDRLGLVQEANRHGRMGVCRAIRADKVLPLLNGKDVP